MSRHFHGQGESIVESLFAGFEDEAATALRLVEETRGGTQAEFETLTQFLWTLAVRTQAVRSELLDVYDSMLDELRRQLWTIEGRASLAEHVRESFDETLADMLEEVGFGKRLLIRAALRIPFLRRRVLAYVEAAVHSGEFSHHLNQFFDVVSAPSLIAPAAGAGHLRGLEHLLASRTAHPGFRPQTWSMEKHERLVLGDLCVVAADENAVAGSLLRRVEAWALCYLPVSPQHLLLAHSGDEVKSIRASEVNRLSAALSNRFFWASEKSDELQQLAEGIGSGAAMFTSDEIRGLVGEGFGRLGG